MNARKPANCPYSSSRKEKDLVEIVSGLFEGKTTGAPICLLIENCDSDSTSYEPMKDLLRPSHANFTYREKYGHFDYLGSGRFSARETAARVAAGAIAKKLLAHFDIFLIAYLKQVSDLTSSSLETIPLDEIQKRRDQSPIFCPDPALSEKMCKKLEEAKKEGDSLGGSVELLSSKLPRGLGDPIYEKLEAKLAYAMLSIPASKGFEIGSGFESVRMKGSEYNDLFVLDEKNDIVTETNHAGGTLGGISSGMPLILRVAFKPTSSIKKPQKTLDFKKESALCTLPDNSRHDSCVAIRAVAIVEAMAALVLADCLLLNRASKL